MAQNRYNLLLFKADRHYIEKQPWYKERLHTKYLSRGKSSGFLIGKDWVFLKAGIDDCRNGFPPFINDGVVISSKDKGIGPNLMQIYDCQDVVRGKNATSNNSSALPNINNKSVGNDNSKNRYFKNTRGTKMIGKYTGGSTVGLTKEEICYDKMIPQQKQRNDALADIEFGLMSHPLALYAHLEEAVPSELFENIVSILDPEMGIVQASNDLMTVCDEITKHNIIEDDDDDDKIEQARKFSPSATRFSLKPTDNNLLQDLKISDEPAGTVALPKLTAQTETDSGNPSNAYMSFYRREDVNEGKKQKKKIETVTTLSPSQDAHIQAVTKEFCNWMSSLGGTSNNIEESTLSSLFASGYETKPALSVPIHVVEVTSVPPELRANLAMPAAPKSCTYSDHSSQSSNAIRNNASMYGGSQMMRYQYGAWYLPKKLWVKRDANVPLRDPSKANDTKQMEAKIKNENLESELVLLHGSRTFNAFLDKKGKRKPEFMVKIAEYQKQADLEEAQKLKAEEAAKRGNDATGNTSLSDRTAIQFAALVTAS